MSLATLVHLHNDLNHCSSGGHPYEANSTPSRHLLGLSRRDFLWTGSTSFATGLLSPVLVGLAVKQSRGESGMNMQGHAGARSVGAPRAPYQKGAPLIEPEVRRSVNGELRTTLQVQYAYKDIGGYRPYLRSYEGTITGPPPRL